MPSLGERLKWRTFLPPLLTIAIFALIFRKIPLEAFGAALSQANYVVFLSALLPFSILYFALDTLVLRYTMRWFHGELAFTDLLPVRAVDYLITLLNNRASQGAMVVYLARRLSTSLLTITSTILFLDLMQRTHLALWASVGMALASETLPRILFLVPLAVVVFWSLFLGYLHGSFARLGRFLRAPDWRLLRTFRIATARQYLMVLALKAPLLLVAVIAHSYAMRGFGFEIPLARLLATLPIVFLVGALPITVARLGTTQAAWIYFYQDLVAPPTLLAYSLAAHLTFLLANAMLGVIFLPRAYRELFGERVASASHGDPSAAS